MHLSYAATRQTLKETRVGKPEIGPAVTQFRSISFIDSKGHCKRVSKNGRSVLKLFNQTPTRDVPASDMRRRA
jgi:hypothetical protein